VTTNLTVAFITFDSDSLKFKI